MISGRPWFATFSMQSELRALCSVIFNNCLDSQQFRSGYTGRSCSSFWDQPGGLPGVTETFRLWISYAQLHSFHLSSVVDCLPIILRHPAQEHAFWKGLLCREGSITSVAVYMTEKVLSKKDIWYLSQRWCGFWCLHFILYSQIKPLPCTVHCPPMKRLPNSAGRPSTTPHITIPNTNNAMQLHI